MDITYDPSKDKLNIAKHGVSLKEAVNINWATFKKEIDRRHDYGEPRFIGYGLIGTRLYSVVFTDRGNQRRIISLRKANQREIRNYDTKRIH